ncbi:MAG: hypothetical protein KIH62_000875 [Candidatus Kerfeldbacteria bacterium]|nr:hypothetical protein [Candidatus Kerfeldbacteria bacterium]
MAKSSFTPPSASDLTIHYRCVLRTFEIVSGANRRLTIRIVDATTEAEANRCWSTLQPPEGTPEEKERYYRADILVAHISEGDELWVKGGNYVDLFTEFSTTLQSAFYDEVDGREVDVKWKEDYHQFGDGNVVHWLVASGTTITLDQLVEFVVEEAGQILSKAPRAERTDGRRR